MGNMALPNGIPARSASRFVSNAMYFALVRGAGTPRITIGNTGFVMKLDAAGVPQRQGAVEVDRGVRRIQRRVVVEPQGACVHPATSTAGRGAISGRSGWRHAPSLRSRSSR